MTKVREQQERERGSTGAREEDISGHSSRDIAQKTNQMQKKTQKTKPTPNRKIQESTGSRGLDTSYIYPLKATSQQIGKECEELRRNCWFDGWTLRGLCRPK